MPYTDQRLTAVGVELQSTDTTTPNKHILIIQGHPDGGSRHFCHALAEAYAQGARDGGHEVREVQVAALDFPLLRTKADWESGASSLPPALLDVQRDITWSQHIVLLFPLWLGGMPALVKGLLEQVARPGFALGMPGKKGGKNGMAKKLLTGRSARIVVTMGMPELVYRWYFRAHSLKALERNILGFVGIAPIHETLIGMVESLDEEQVDDWLHKLRALGSKGA